MRGTVPSGSTDESVRIDGVTAEVHAGALQLLEPGRNLFRVPTRQSRAGRMGRLRAGLPVFDLAAAVVLALLVLAPWQPAVAFALLTVPAIGLADVYAGTPAGGGVSLRILVRLTVAAIGCEWVAFMLAGALGEPLAPVSAATLLGATVAAWCLARWGVGRLEARSPERVLILGSGVAAAHLVELVERHSGGRLEILGFLDDQPADGATALPRLGSVAQLQRVVAQDHVDRVFVAFTGQSDETLLEALRRCDHLGVRIDIIPRLSGYLGSRLRSYALGAVPLITVRGRRGRGASRAFKRAFDIAVSGAALVVAAPILAMIALAIWLENRGPIMFAQERVGRFGRPFMIFKFRSMPVDADHGDGEQITALRQGAASIAEAVATIKSATMTDPRVTRVGSFLRCTSLDELPQLWNVFMGDMSLVGPRPLRSFEVEALKDWELIRQLERPGLTGLWQVSGRSETSWDERMQLDYAYARHWSLADDAQILARTLPAVVSRDGAW